MSRRDRNAELFQVSPYLGRRYRGFKGNLWPVSIVTLRAGAEYADSLPHPDAQSMHTVLPILVGLEMAFTAVQVSVVHVNRPTVLGCQKVHPFAIVTSGTPKAIISVIDNQIGVFFLELTRSVVNFHFLVAVRTGKHGNIFPLAHGNLKFGRLVHADTKPSLPDDCPTALVRIVNRLYQLFLYTSCIHAVPNLGP